MKKQLAVLLVLVLFSGCSSHYSTLTSEKSDQSSIYTISPDEALEAAQWALLHTIPGHAITKINGPIRGYSSYTRFAFDSYAQQVLVIGAEGIDKDGSMVCGFYFEVSGQGSSGSGMSYNSKIFKNLQTHLDQTGKEVLISNLHQLRWKEVVRCYNSGLE